MGADSLATVCTMSADFLSVFRCKHVLISISGMPGKLCSSKYMQGQVDNNQTRPSSLDEYVSRMLATQSTADSKAALVPRSSAQTAPVMPQLPFSLPQQVPMIPPLLSLLAQTAATVPDMPFTCAQTAALVPQLPHSSTQDASAQYRLPVLPRRPTQPEVQALKQPPAAPRRQQASKFWGKVDNVGDELRQELAPINGVSQTLSSQQMPGLCDSFSDMGLAAYIQQENERLVAAPNLAYTEFAPFVHAAPQQLMNSYPDPAGPQRLPSSFIQMHPHTGTCQMLPNSGTDPSHMQTGLKQTHTALEEAPSKYQLKSHCPNDCPSLSQLVSSAEEQMGLVRQLSMPIRSTAELLTRLNSPDLGSSSTQDATSMLKMPLDTSPGLVQELPMRDRVAGVRQVLKHPYSGRPELTTPAALYPQPPVMMKPHPGITIVCKHDMHLDQYIVPAAFHQDADCSPALSCLLL